jgi:predicted phosphodiesterase
MLDRIAVISDVHGNVTALRAVLADIEARGITRVVNLGDVIGKGPRGSEAVQLTREACEVTVRGNWDSFIADDAAHLSPLAQWTRDELSNAELAWLAALPATCEFVISGHRVRLFHASQTSEFVRVRSRHSDEEFRGMFTNTEFTGAFRVGHTAEAGVAAKADAVPDVVGYGDIHRAYLKANEGLTLFNVGGTGNHLDAPSAPYVILEGVVGSPEPAPFSVSFARVAYDIQAEISVARELGLPEADAYARELLDGIYRGRAARPVRPASGGQVRGHLV